MKAYRLGTAVTSMALVVLGLAMMALALRRGGAWLGLLLGALFVAAGAARLFLLRRT